eukprot:scaffold673_cov410-Prasinococcus_capsulatus_cf.AAC.1
MLVCAAHAALDPLKRRLPGWIGRSRPDRRLGAGGANGSREFKGMGRVLGDGRARELRGGAS